MSNESLPKYVTLTREMLIEEVNRLNQEIDVLKSERDMSHNSKLEQIRIDKFIIGEWEAANNKLKSKLAKAKSTLEFYGDGDNWTTADEKSFSSIRSKNFPIGDTDSEYSFFDKGYKGGRRARQALRDIE